MTRELHGAGGAAGVALGRAVVYRPSHAATAIVDADPNAALGRFAAAQSAAAARLRTLAERFRTDNRAHDAGIFDAQAMLVEDDFLTEEITRLVREEDQTLESALDTTTGQMRAAMEALDDEYLRERAADMDAIGRMIHAELRGGTSGLADLPDGAIVLAADLTPAETAELRPDAVAGFATAYGGPTGHTAILARSLGIPAVVGLGESLLDVADGTDVVLDGDNALLLIAPSAAQRRDYKARISAASEATERRAALRSTPGALADGQAVALWANIGRPEEAALADKHGAEGIGLFRTEFLFLDRSAAPTEDEQYNAYSSVLRTMGDRPVVVRTLDIGGDKPLPYIQMPHEDNPFLGVRGLRLCMQRPDLFAHQLRALLRAAVHGNLWIMLPMVATAADLAWGRAQIKAAADALSAENVDHRASVPLGIMIETPAAAIMADLFAKEAAFFSVGSNDLTQYALAADRGQSTLAAQYRHDDPAVLRLIGTAAKAAAGAGIPIGVCGELAAVPEAAVLLAGLGINELSMAPAAIPLVKERFRATTFAQAQQAATAALLPS